MPTSLLSEKGGNPVSAPGVGNVPRMAVDLGQWLKSVKCIALTLGVPMAL